MTMSTSCFSLFKTLITIYLGGFLLASVIRVQFRSDRGWQLNASDLISSRSTWVPV